VPTISERPTQREYGPPREPGLHRETCGFTAICKCRWVRWGIDQGAASTVYAKHVKGCKAHRVEVDAA
jgi:hypothetical protein